MAGAGGGGKGPCERYERMFDRFFAKTRLAGTYKPVLLAAVIDAVRHDARRESGRVEVGMDSVAARFAKFYFDTADFSLRHTPERMSGQDNPRADVNIARLVRGEIARREAGDRRPDERIPTLEELAGGGMERFRRSVVAEAIRPEALKSLRKDLPGLLKGGPRGQSIVIDAEAAEYMVRSRSVLMSALTAMLVRHLEGINPTERHMMAKIDLEAGDVRRRIRNVDRLRIAAIGGKDGQGPKDKMVHNSILRLHGISLQMTDGLERLAGETGGGGRAA